MADDRNQISPGARLAFLREAFRNREAAAQARDLAAATELTDVRTEYIAQGRRFDEMADRLEGLANGMNNVTVVPLRTRSPLSMIPDTGAAELPSPEAECK